MSPPISRQPNRKRQLLDPPERIAEVLFGLIMVLTFTGSLSVADAGRGDVHAMLIGAVGCNLAWGIIDGLFYLMGCITEKASALRMVHRVRTSVNGGQTRDILAEALPGEIVNAISASQADAIREEILNLPNPPGKPHLSRRDLAGAIAVFFWVFMATFPVAIPFVLFHDLPLAMRISNGIAIVLLFLAGFAYGRVSGHRPVFTGFCMVLIGAALVSMTIALGG